MGPLRPPPLTIRGLGRSFVLGLRGQMGGAWSSGGTGGWQHVRAQLGEDAFLRSGAMALLESAGILAAHSFHRVPQPDLTTLVGRALEDGLVVLVERPADPTPEARVRTPSIPMDQPLARPPRLKQERPLPTVSVELERLYHDEPVHDAPFELEAADGSIVEGKLNASGTATVPDLPPGAMRVRFGADARPYAVKDTTKNPEYSDLFTAASAEDLVARYIK